MRRAGCPARVCRARDGSRETEGPRPRSVRALEDLPARAKRGGRADTLSSPESDRPQVPPTSSGRVPAGRDDGQPTAVGDDSSAPRALSVFLLSLVGLIVVVLVARPAAAVGRRVRSSMTRTAAAVVSPLRSVATVPRSKLAGSSFRPASPRSRTPSRRGPSTRPRLIPGFSDDSRNMCGAERRRGGRPDVSPSAPVRRREQVSREPLARFYISRCAWQPPWGPLFDQPRLVSSRNAVRSCSTRSRLSPVQLSVSESHCC